MDAILFGNGFNLLTDGCPTWAKLLKSLSKQDDKLILDKIPPTLQYEQVCIASRPSVAPLLSETAERELKEKVRASLSVINTNDFYKRLQNLGVSVFLTTNYDHAFYDNAERSVIARNHSEKVYSIKRWKTVRVDKRDFTLFQIHGDISNLQSIMLGLDHYGGALANVQDYVKGYAKEKSSNKKSSGPSGMHYSISRRLMYGDSPDTSAFGFTDNGTSLISWIDAFFFADLHIIGINLDFSEIDLWWLLSRRARLLKNNLAKNRIYYYPTFPLSEIEGHRPKLQLLEQMNVTVVYHNQTAVDESGNPDYPAIYDVQLQNLKTRLDRGLERGE